MSSTRTHRIFAHGVNFLEQVDDAWLPADQTRIDAILDNLSIYCAVDMLFLLAHSSWGLCYSRRSKCVKTATHATSLLA
jgi:hypothetical protein